MTSKPPAGATTNIYLKYDIQVNDQSISRFAQEYIRLRSTPRFDIKELAEDPLFRDTGFSVEKLMKVIQEATIPKRGKSPSQLDIYRADLGEMIMYEFFEKEIERLCPGEELFLVPFKNINDREIADAPARGNDLIGYKDKKGHITLLLGEAKVSEEKANPPQVVHAKDDSLFKTHLMHKTDKEYLLRKLGEFVKKLDNKHKAPIAAVLLAMHDDINNVYDVVFGCCLVRDSHCVDEGKDFGKLKSEQQMFEPGRVTFVIPCFDKSITETTELFYNAVHKTT